MKYLLIKQLRDLKKDIVRNTAIFIITALAIFFFSGLNAVGRNIKNSIDSFYERQNLAAYTISAKLSPEDVQKIREEFVCDGAVTFDPVSYKAGKVNRSLSISLYLSNEFPVNTPELTQGELPQNYFDALIDTAFATANGIKAGDTLTVNIEGSPQTVAICGLARFPDALYKGAEIPQIAESGILKVYVDTSLFEGSAMPVIDELYILSDLDEDELRTQLANITGLDFASARILDRTENVSVMRVRSDIELIGSLMNILPVICLIALCLILYVNMSKRIEDESYNIGVMTASGLKRTHIAVAYSLPYFVLVMAGGIVGSVVGIFVLPSLYIGLLSQFYTLPVITQSGLFFSVALPLVILASVTIASLIMAIIGTISKTPTVLMRGDNKKSVRFTGRLKLPIVCKLSLRNFISYRKKTILTIISATLCLGLLFTSFLLDNSVSNLESTVYGKYYNFDATIGWNSGDKLNYEDIKKYVTDKEMISDVKFCVEVPASVFLPEEKNVMVTIVDGSDPCYIIYNDNERVEYTDEGVYVPASYGEIQSIKITIYADMPLTLDMPVAGTYEDIGVFGVIVPSETLKKHASLAYAVLMANTGMLTKIYGTLNKNADARQTEEFIDEMSNEFGAAFIYERHGVNSKRYEKLFIVLDITEVLLFVIVGAIMILLILNISCLSIADRIKDYTVFKALGIGAKKINLINSLENYFSIIIAYLLSIPTGMAISRSIIKVVTQITGVVVYLHLYALSAIILLGGAALFTALGNILINVKISKVDIVTTLKIKD